MVESTLRLYSPLTPARPGGYAMSMSEQNRPKIILATKEPKNGDTQDGMVYYIPVNKITLLKQNGTTYDVIVDGTTYKTKITNRNIENIFNKIPQ